VSTTQHRLQAVQQLKAAGKSGRETLRRHTHTSADVKNMWSCVYIPPPCAVHTETSRFALFITQTAQLIPAAKSCNRRTSRLSVSFCFLKLHNRQGVPRLWVHRATIVIVGCFAGYTLGNHRPLVGHAWGRRRGESSPCYSSSAETFVVFASNFHV